MTVALDVAGAAAPPRDNGELVFAEPWESRAFGMAVALAEAGAFTWDEFRDRLVARIDARATEQPFRYYEHWLGALEDVLVGSGSLAVDDVGVRSEALADRPAGHDHRDHDHTDHDHSGHGHGH